jgi:hypothetical protein
MSCFKEIVSELLEGIKNYDVTSSSFFEILFFEFIDFTFSSGVWQQFHARGTHELTANGTAFPLKKRKKKFSKITHLYDNLKCQQMF